MEIIKSLLIEHSALQAIIVLSIISAAGILLGKIRVGGISLGITFVFFVGIFAGHLGLSIDGEMLKYAEILSADFPFVRTDFYCIDGKIYFGEMTLYPSGGFDCDILPETDALFGSLIDIN